MVYPTYGTSLLHPGFSIHRPYVCCIPSRELLQSPPTPLQIPAWGLLVWNTFAHTIKMKLGFKTIHSDAGVYVLCHHYKGGYSEMEMILILYIDDLLLLGEDPHKIDHVKRELGKMYQIKDLRPALSYLGIRITRDRKR